MKKQWYFICILLGIFSCNETAYNENKSSKPITNQHTSIPDNSITNLYDAFGKNNDELIKDFGFSALIKYKGKLILFDSGTNADILKNNAEALGIDLSKVDFAVGSHAHGDHINGFDYLLSVNPKVKIYLPFDFFMGSPIKFNIAGKEEDIKDSLPVEMRYFDGEKTSIRLVQSGRFWNANIEYIDKNTRINPDIQLVYTKSPYLGYCSKYPSKEHKHQTDNNDIKYNGLPELSLSLSTKDGEVLIVGCSHSSVQNIIKETKTISNNEIALLAGGYHMLPYDREELKKVALQLKQDFQVKQIAPTHCTGHLAFKLLQEEYGEDYLFAGLGENIFFEAK